MSAKSMLDRRAPTGLARQVTDLVARGGEAEPDGRQQRIPIAAIKPHPEQPRRTIDPASITRLAANIKRMGLLNPITVRQSGPGEYELMAGQRRLKACEHNGDTDILARVFLRNEPSAALVENIQREDLSVVETARAILRLMEQENLDDQSAVADLLGMERSRVSRILGVLKLPQDVLDDYEKHVATVSATRLFEVASGGTEDRQRHLWTLAKAGLTERELREAKRSDATLNDAAAKVADEKPTRFRPMAPGRAMLGTLDRLNRSFETLDTDKKPLDDDHRAQLQKLRDRIDRLLG